MGGIAGLSFLPRSLKVQGISKSPVKTIFASEALKHAVLHPTAGNPLEQTYIVDVGVETRQNRPVLYKVQAVNGVITPDAGNEAA